jgi:hypothetical protein
MVKKVCEDGLMAGCILRYVDDIRPIGPSEEAAWQVSHRVGSYFSYLGLQITSRKFRSPSQQPGP